MSIGKRFCTKHRTFYTEAECPDCVAERENASKIEAKKEKRELKKEFKKKPQRKENQEEYQSKLNALLNKYNTK